MSSGTLFEANFWGDGNQGFEVLLQNLKTGIAASKELGEFIRERTAVEDGYVKSLSKMSKTISHVPDSSMGAFSPVWKVLKDMCDQLMTIHTKFVKDLTDLAKEISDYSSAQRDKLKQNLRDEIEAAQDSLNTLQNTEANVQRTKKQYEHSVEQLNKMIAKNEKAKSDPATNQKTKLQLESRVKQARTWMETMKGDHQNAVQKNCDQLMEFQGKMVEACRKFESLEEEHLAQMVTFMLKVSRTQNSSHFEVGQIYSTVNSQMDFLSVEKLLKDFVESKGTGSQKPTPYKFKAMQVSEPTGVPASMSSEDLRTPSPSTTRSNNTSKDGGKTFRGRFKKKKTKQAPSSNGPVDNQQPPENAPEVDEEGYSIRPQDAASFSQFPDDHSNQRPDSDSDSDYDEPESKIKKLTIRKIADIPQASVDDIKASVMTLKVGATSPGIRKATSSQSLNLLDTTPPTNRRLPTTNSSNNIVDDSKSSDSASGSALIDIDDILLDSSALSQMPAPLLPTSSTAKPLLPAPFDADTAHHIDPTATLSPWTLPSPNTSSSSKTTDTSPPGPKPIPRPRTGSLKSTQQPTKPPQQQPTKQQEVHIPATTQPSDVFGPRNASEPVIKPSMSEAPTIPGKKQRTTSGPEIIVESQSQGSLSSITESTETITNSLSSSDITPTNSNTQQTPPKDDSSNKPPPSSGSYHVPIEVGDKENKAGDTSPKLASKNTTSVPILAPPLPAPRRGTSRKRSANTSNSDLTPGLVSPLATNQISSSRSGSASPITFNNGNVSSGTGLNVPAQNPPLPHAIPLAIAFQETCNAIFKGTDVTKCLIKVEGEMVMSFPADFISKVNSYDLLSFRLEHMESVVGLRHNQRIVKKESDDHLYKFDKQALFGQLSKMQEKKTSPFYNIQILKYEVKVESGKSLPLRLTAFWKCEPSVTNFRLDYSYNSSVFHHESTKPSLCNVAFTVPISGGVRNALSKPNGNWSPDNNTMRWKIGDIQPLEEPVSSSLHAKFDVSSGPSVPAPVVAQFTCSGATLSGLSFQLNTDAYKVSLLKNKCSSGKYTAEINKA